MVRPERTAANWAQPVPAEPLSAACLRGIKVLCSWFLGSCYSETARVQAKLRVVVLSSYSRWVVFCNAVHARALDRILREAFPCQVARGLRACPPFCADSSGPDVLRLERRDRCFDCVHCDAPRFEIVPHEEVAHPAL